MTPKEKRTAEAIVIRKITFSRDLKDSDFRDLREMLGDKIVQEATRYVVVAFDDATDCLAFLVAIRQVKITPIGRGEE